MLAIQELNIKLARKQAELKVQPNQLNLSTFLVKPTTSGPYTNYPGDADKMSEVLEANIDIVQSKIASVDEAIFIYKNNWDMIEETKKQAASEILKKLNNLRQNLQILRDIYRSMIISPGVTIIEDGERENPNCFHIIIEPVTSELPFERERLLKEWKQLLTELEASVSQVIDLQI